jgi:hypothetical protein
MSRKRNDREFDSELPRYKRIDMDSTDDDSESEEDSTEQNMDDDEPKIEEEGCSSLSSSAFFPLLKKHHVRKIDQLEDELIRKSRRFTLHTSINGENIPTSQLLIALPASTTGSPLTDKPLEAAWLNTQARSDDSEPEDFKPKLPLKNKGLRSKCSVSSTNFAGEISHADFFVVCRDDDILSLGNCDTHDSDSDSLMEINCA